MREVTDVVVFTCITGGIDVLQDPLVVSEGSAFVCFTDDDGCSSAVWQIRRAPSPFADPRRNSRLPKILSHRYFPEFSYSVWAGESARQWSMPASRPLC